MNGRTIDNHRLGVNVCDFGARGDGITDDTDAIQVAVNHVFDNGGGTVFFPFTPAGYRIAKPGTETVDGKACRSQLYIPSSYPVDDWRSICLEGEVPVLPLRNYRMRDGQGRWPATEFSIPIVGSTLISDCLSGSDHGKTLKNRKIVLI